MIIIIVYGAVLSARIERNALAMIRTYIRNVPRVKSQDLLAAVPGTWYDIRTVD